MRIAAWTLLSIVELLASADIGAAAPPALFEFGSQGSGPGQFITPTAIAFDDSGNVYLTDSNLDRVTKYSVDGTYVTHWGGTGSGDGQLEFVQGIAVDDSGHVFVADTDNGRIQKFDRDGAYLSQWPVILPSDLEFHPVTGELYCADEALSNPSIYVFDSIGNQLDQFPVPGNRGGSTLAFGPGGQLYVRNAPDDVVLKCTDQGTILDTVGGPGEGADEFISLRGLGTDDNGNVYTTDTGFDRIQVFDSTGTLLAVWGYSGSNLGALDRPVDIRVLGSSRIYVFEQGTERVQVFQQINHPPVVEVTSPFGSAVFSPGEVVTVRWAAHDDSLVTDVDVSYVKDFELLGATSGTSQLYVIDPLTGGASLRGPIGFDDVTGMEMDPSTGVLYGVGRRSGTMVQVLLTIDPGSGAGTEVGPLGETDPVLDLEFDEGGDGTLYANSFFLTSRSKLLSVLPLSGATTTYPFTGEVPTGPGGIVFGTDGVLYMTMAQSSSMTRRYKVATTTGALFEPRLIGFPVGFESNPILRGLDRRPFHPGAYCIIRDDDTAEHLATVQLQNETPFVTDLIGPTQPNLLALAWVSGPETSIANGAPNDGELMWVVPEDPTNAARIRVRAHDGVGGTGVDLSEGLLGLLTTTGTESNHDRGTFLAAPTPNPTLESVTVRFGLSTPGPVRLAVYDIRGRLIRNLVSREIGAGEHAVRWDTRDENGGAVASGTYVLRLHTSSTVRSSVVSVIR